MPRRQKFLSRQRLRGFLAAFGVLPIFVGIDPTDNARLSGE
jgi:hypothetical protein